MSITRFFFSLVKALHARLEEVRPSELWGDDSKYVWLFFPTVVLNTALYLIDTSCDEPKPILSDHVSYVREISTSKYRGYYLLDFVTQEGLLNFVHEKVEKFSLAVADVIENNPELFLEGPSLLWNQ